jgi:hypothetical protein
MQYVHKIARGRVAMTYGEDLRRHISEVTNDQFLIVSCRSSANVGRSLVTGHWSLVTLSV